MHMAVESIIIFLQIESAFHSKMRHQRYMIHPEDQILAPPFKPAEMFMCQCSFKRVHIILNHPGIAHMYGKDLFISDLLFQRSDNRLYFRQLRHYLASYQSFPTAHSAVKGTFSFMAFTMPSLISCFISSISSSGTLKISSS